MLDYKFPLISTTTNYTYLRSQHMYYSHILLAIQAPVSRNILNLRFS